MVGILIVDDQTGQLLDYREEFNEAPPSNITLYLADSLEKAQSIFESCEVSTIILDGCVPGDELNTLPFIKMVLDSGFDGMLVAASSLPKYRDMMVAAGCTHQASKNQAVQLVLRHLNQL